MFLELTRQEVLASDLHLLLQRIAVDLYDLHAVSECRLNAAQAVCRSNEKHFAQIITQFDEIVCEAVVLLGVKHLQHSTAGVALSTIGDLVDLVEHKYRIGGLCFFEGLDDPTGHGTDVGLPMTSDFRFIAQPAEGHTHILSLQGPGHRFPKRCLSHTWRPVQTEDGRFPYRPSTSEQRDIPGCAP